VMVFGKHIFGIGAELLWNSAVAVCCGHGMEVLNRRNAGRIVNGATICPERAGLKFIPVICAPREKARREIDVDCQLVCHGLSGSGHERPLPRSACGGLPLLLRFSSDRSFHVGARSDKAWRGRNDFGNGRLRFREQGSERVDQGADHFGGGHGGRLE
jgi:hypothetical protein